jgi:hypothetical protein
MIEQESIALVDSIDLDPLLGRIIHGDASRGDYVQFLESTYHYIRWSGPLLAETAGGLRRSGRCPRLLEILDAKTAEETPHDGWVLDDLAKCGGDITIVQASAAPRAVETYVLWSQLMAEEGSPAFLGAAYALEFISMQRARMAAENLRARKVIPDIEDAVSFLEGHGDADVDHIARLNDVLRWIDDPQDQAAITRSAMVLCALYPRFFHSGAAGRPHPGGAVEPLRCRVAAH